MTSLLSKLFNAGSQLSELDKLQLDGVRRHLTPELAVLWDRQVQAINKVQRLPEGVEVDFYRMEKGRPTFDEKLAFPNKNEELLVATLQLALSITPEKLLASLWCVKGFIFSIEYAGSISYFEEALGMDPRPELSVTCELKADLSKG